ncbi:nuclease-like protein [Trichococcus patagoniensis]|uniref:Nuclease-like protein n=1 Tax=Trichococcus patagoniensis TaxID=382641 RepID=A0A2T5IJ32_9LACT|nr:nuclease-related domain-containing protein [Trichococcus patagoniensis]PTQ83812.1 nuclease-like protein [Trichococcus patagoniensis]
MAFKERTKPKLLRIYEILHKRMHLGNRDYNYYINFDKGFEGECGLDEQTEQLGPDWLVLNDLQLEFRLAPFQIDTLLISSDVIVLLETKNYEGVHQWGERKLTKQSGLALENPSMQVKKTQTRLEFLLATLGCQMKVEAFVIFINPEFTLLGAPKDEGYILPSQIPGFLRNLRKKLTKLTVEQEKLASALVNLHDPNYPCKIPEYHYDQLRKGIPCPNCGMLEGTFKGHHQTCLNCGQRMNVKRCIKASIEEFRILFPEEKMTTSRMMEWCGSGDKDRVYRVLKEEYTATGKNSGRYYH